MKVSVIIPAYNEEKYIGKCLDSLLKQTYEDLEIIVINDGSKDKTLKIIRNYEKKYKEKIKNKLKIFFFLLRHFSYFLILVQKLK